MRNNAAVVRELIEFAEVKNVCEAEMIAALNVGMLSFALSLTRESWLGGLGIWWVGLGTHPEL